ncbi:hypothetical protein Syun_017429 [Stephania yunnanensis]|uniref:Reverse transcriptase domain-containing protein n=1 Tax=Stephania yunnanensis TaxID=152371 RepID=A0AAP0P2D4_9MAGN
MNSSLITLILKVKNLKSFSEFKHINPCTVNYKLIMNVIANRFKQVMQTLVGLEQLSFVAGRRLTNNIIVAQELVHSLRNVTGDKGWIAVKLDSEKAYDRLAWDFIQDALEDAQIMAVLAKVILGDM